MSSYTITVYVENISSVISLYDTVRIYRSTTGLQADRVLYDTFVLSAGQSTYDWVDVSGDSTYVAWFTYYNSSSSAESSFSASISYSDLGEHFVPGFYFSDITYPEELSMSLYEEEIVYSIRNYVGDQKSVKRDYVNPSCSLGYENVSDDGYTYTLTERGWPLKVVKDGVQYTTTSNPTVSDYTYLTFSGTTISTVSGVVDVWYESFRYSDTEILSFYTTTTAPPYVSSSGVTDEIMIISSAIMILRNEVAHLLGETSGKFSLDQHLSYDPEGVIKQKRALIADLQKKLDDVAGEVVLGNITGVRVD